MQLLGETADGSAGGGVIHRTLTRRERGVTEEDPLLSTTFNVVGDAVVRHWDSLVAETAWGDNSNNNEAGKTATGRKI